MNKVISYFMARTVDLISREKYMNEISNELLKEYLCELRIEIERLENLLPFDEPEKLHNLYDIMNKYYKKFCRKYKPIRKWYI